MAGANTQFAVAAHVLTYLAGAGRDRAISSEELSESVGVNPVHIRRVLGPLRVAGVVRSRPGAAGGWELTRDPQDVHLDEVWMLINGDDPVVPSHRPNPSCPIGRQITRELADVEDAVSAAIRRELSGRTVAGLIAGVPAGSLSGL